MKTEITIKLDYPVNLFDIEKRMSPFVKVTEVSADLLEFEAEWDFSYLFRGELFTMIDYGSIHVNDDEVKYSVVSVRYWIQVVFTFGVIFFLPASNGLSLEVMIIGFLLSSIISIFTWQIAKWRHGRFIRRMLA